MNQRFKEIVKLFQKLPGVGPRQAARFVISLMEKPESELKEFGYAIQNLKKEISFCPVCFNVSNNGKCSVCNDNKRDKQKILVIEKVADLDSIEKTGLYKGLYHVLGGVLNPIEGVNAENLRIKELQKRVTELAKAGTIELILANNPGAAGETTSVYLRDLFKDSTNVNITRLARGLASGSNLEYADESTLRNALEYRK